MSGAVILLGLPTSCGSDGDPEANSGAIPVKTVETPTTTTRYRVPTSGMEPTLHCAMPGPGCEADVEDWVVTEEPPRDVARGDVVVFVTPPRAEEQCPPGGLFIKRIIGLPGETWEQRDGHTFINGNRLDEPYISDARRGFETYEPTRIPGGEYFLMGDNRGQSCDSRGWGTVPRANIRGKVIEIQRPG